VGPQTSPGGAPKQARSDTPTGCLHACAVMQIVD
jgi:hypothetical protein